MPNMKKSKSMEKMPARRMPEGVEFPKNKKTMPNKPATKRPGAKPAPLGTPPAKPTGRRPANPKTTKKSPGKMTPQDAAMKKILEKKYGKIYG